MSETQDAAATAQAPPADPDLGLRIQAARKYDYEHRRDNGWGGSWGSVPEAQVLRLLTGAGLPGIIAERDNLRALPAEILSRFAPHCADPDCETFEAEVSYREIAEWDQRAGLSDGADGGVRPEAPDEARDLRALVAVMLSWTEERLRFELTPDDEAKITQFRQRAGITAGTAGQEG